MVFATLLCSYSYCRLQRRYLNESDISYRTTFLNSWPNVLYRFFWFGGTLGSAPRVEFPVSPSNHVSFTPRLLYSSPHHSSESFTNLKTGWAQDAWLQWSHENWYFQLDITDMYYMVWCKYLIIQGTLLLLNTCMGAKWSQKWLRACITSSGVWDHGALAVEALSTWTGTINVRATSWNTIHSNSYDIQIWMRVAKYNSFYLTCTICDGSHVRPCGGRWVTLGNMLSGSGPLHTLGSTQGMKGGI